MNFENFIKIAADTVQELRRCDVDRLFGWSPPSQHQALAEWLTIHRPDLADEVRECLAEAAEVR